MICCLFLVLTENVYAIFFWLDNDICESQNVVMFLTFFQNFLKWF